MNIAIVGLGLIGGSFAKALKKYTNHTVLGYNRSAGVLDSALAEGAIDKKIEDNDFTDADLVIFGLYPEQTVGFVKNNISRFKKGSIIIDTCGVKTKICDELDAFCADNGCVFIGCHPMAGKEKSGFAAADSELFRDASFIMTPQKANENAVGIVQTLAQQIGFGKIVKTTPEIHDSMIAFTSQLPHVLACAYISDPASVNHDGFSAGSFKDVSRVATINAEMWSQLFFENKEPLTAHIDILMNNLEKFKKLINSGGDGLYSELKKANDINEEINGKN